MIKYATKSFKWISLGDIMFKGNDIKPFESKVWLSSPTMHGEEIKCITEAYETNWMSTVGKI